MVREEESVGKMSRATDVSASRPGSARLLSVDALRGFDIFWIVGAGAVVRALEKIGDHSATTFLATQLTHVQWGGFRFYDLIEVRQPSSDDPDKQHAKKQGT